MPKSLLRHNDAIVRRWWCAVVVRSQQSHQTTSCSTTTRKRASICTATPTALKRRATTAQPASCDTTTCVPTPTPTRPRTATSLHHQQQRYTTMSMAGAMAGVVGVKQVSMAGVKCQGAFQWCWRAKRCLRRQRHACASLLLRSTCHWCAFECAASLYLLAAACKPTAFVLFIPCCSTPHPCHSLSWAFSHLRSLHYAADVVR